MLLAGTVECLRTLQSETKKLFNVFRFFLVQAIYFSAYLSTERIILKGFTPRGSRSMVGDILRHEYCIQHSLTVTQRCLVKVFCV